MSETTMIRRWWNRLLWRIGWVDGGRNFNGRATWQRTTYDYKTRWHARYVLRRGGDWRERDDWLETYRWRDPLLSLVANSPQRGDFDVQALIAESDWLVLDDPPDGSAIGDTE